MPRQGVPYPSREICSLKCQIDALNAKINELMKSINGVQGDGQGNVSLISGDPAVVINNDASQNQIEIALDSSQLPAAAVSSVNSQTGAVVLEADDIPSDGNSDVQADIDALKALGVNLQGAISNEVTARGNADAALQGNINAVSAGLPAAAAAAVAADPTVAQLAVDVPNKLDKITSGSSLKAYTHTGATQGEKSVVDGTAADSIAIRDANGRLQAADPASGATDKTLVTSNWVSQSGAGRPNNLIHAGGSESFTSPKTFEADIRIDGIYNNKSSQNVANSSTWIKVYECIPNVSNQMLALLVCPQKPYQNSDEYGILIVGGSYSGPYAKWILKGQGIITSNFVVVGTNDNTLEVWVKNYNGNRGISFTRLAETNWGNLTDNWSVTQVSDSTFDYTTYPYYKVSE